jgi:hypothetical protein
MKNVVVRLFVLGFLVFAASVCVVADTFPVPLCYPRPCSTK